ncbi:MAG TPA: tetratricopeptide repeat protein [Thermoanaerobaculia bacterium]|jgi:tetratricopeptide (TPR) repeat protein
MNAPTTDWTSALAILVAGLALGALFVFFFNKRKTRVIGDDATLARKDLEAKRDALIQRLRDLDETASADERVRLEKETAAVLRELDESPVVTSAPVTPTAASLAMSPTTKGFLWGAGSFAALAGLMYFVMQVAQPRQEGDMLTGNLPTQQQQGAAAAQQQANPALLQLEAAVKSDPENLQLRNDLARAYLDADQLMNVFEQTKFVLAKAPQDSRALTYQAFVRMNMGDTTAAEQMLHQASKSDPKNLDAWVALAWLYMQQDKKSEAEAMIAEAAKQSPGDKAQLEDVFRQMQQQAAQPGGAPQQADGGELPAGHPPIDGAAPAAPSGMAPAPATAAGPSVTVTLDLDPAAHGKNGVLFVMARNAMGGPPVAVKRLQVAQFPVTFTLGQADSMMGQPFPANFRLEARLDADGNPMTKTPNDPTAMQDGVTPGATVRLALK